MAAVETTGCALFRIPIQEEQSAKDMKVEMETMESLEQEAGKMFDVDELTSQITPENRHEEVTLEVEGHELI